MDCPKCTEEDIHGFLSSSDQLWMEFEADVINGYLHTVYWCKRCDFNQEKKFDPCLIHDHVERGRVVEEEE